MYDPYTYQLIDRRMSWLINFYNSSCGPCQDFTPTWNRFAESYHHVLRMGQVDCQDEDSHEICLQFRIASYPTIIYLNNDKYFRLGSSSVPAASSRTFEKLEDFVLRLGYLGAEDKGRIPHKLAGFKKKVSYKKMKEIKQGVKHVGKPKKTKSFAQRIMSAVDHIFDEHWTRLQWFPSWLRCVTILGVISTPFWCVLFCKVLYYLDS